MTRIQIHHVAALGSKDHLSDAPLQSVCVLGNAIAFLLDNTPYFAPATSASLAPISLPFARSTAATNPSTTTPPLPSTPTAPTAAPNRILTALALGSFGRNTADMAILLGDDAGCVHIVNPQLQLCLSQRLWREPVKGLRVVTADLGSPPGSESPLPQSECFVVTFPNAVARIPAFEVLAALKTFKATGRAQDHKIVVDLWNMTELLGGGGQARLDALCLGPCPFSPASLLHAPASEGELIVTVGEGISLAGAVGEATPAAGGSMLLKMAQGAVQGVLGALAKAPGSAASSWLLGRLRGREGQEPAGPGPSSVAAGLLASLTPDDEELRLALQENPPKACSMLYGMDDPPRSIRRIAVASGPWSRTGALLDNLGRVLIVDLASGLVLHVLKGYRDAQVAWVGGGAAEPLFLLIAIPKLRQIEAWRYEGSGGIARAAALDSQVQSEGGTERFPRAPDIQLVAPTAPFGCFGPPAAAAAATAANAGRGQDSTRAHANAACAGPSTRVQRVQRTVSGHVQYHVARDALPLLIYKTGMDGVLHIARVEL